MFYYLYLFIEKNVPNISYPIEALNKLHKVEKPTSSATFFTLRISIHHIIKLTLLFGRKHVPLAYTKCNSKMLRHTRKMYDNSHKFINCT